MKHRRFKIGCIAIAIFLLLAVFAGCSGNSQETSSAVTGSAQIDGSQTPEQSATATPEPSASESSDSSALLGKMMEKAKEGMVINCDYPVENTVIDDVIKDWGEPDSSEYVEDAGGTYDTYNSKNIVFGFNKGAQIFEVRSFDPELKTITVSAVESAYGKPDHTSEIVSEGQQIYGYVVNDNYKMLLVFDMSSDSQDPKLDHYSVFYPAGTVNSMAGDPGREW